MTDPRALIDRLNLAPHPEGGWYRETWRGPAGAGGRASGTAIHFLLEAGQRSHWHRVDAEEIWLWHAGSRSPCRSPRPMKTPPRSTASAPT
jgi:predicted cupin superfamily sugar epimerase